MINCVTIVWQSQIITVAADLLEQAKDSRLLATSLVFAVNVNNVVKSSGSLRSHGRATCVVFTAVKQMDEKRKTS